MKLNIDLPAKLEFLYTPARYKIVYSGRGAGKSWAFANALKLRALQKPTRILCAREIQKSIKQSVHTLIKDRIEADGLSGYFEVLDTTIRCRITKSEFLYTGLQGHTVDTIKSFEGCDIVWVEEAQTVPKRSWEILIPTIRKQGSEIWMSLNPELDTDYTYKQFIENPPPGAVVQYLSYRDNPFFPDVLEYERMRAKETMEEDDYNNIWEGKPRSAVIGAIYAKEIQALLTEGRADRALYNPRLPVHFVTDLGWGDSTVVGFFQRTADELRIIDYIEDDHKPFDWYLAEIQKRNYNRGVFIMPHDASAGNIRTTITPEQMARQFGFQTHVLPNSSIEQGIKAVKVLFRNIIVDGRKCAPLVEHLRRYRRHENQRTGVFSSPVHDEHSHAADMMRYAAMGLEYMRNEEPDTPFSEWRQTVPGMGY